MSSSSYLLISLAVGSILLLAGGILWVLAGRVTMFADPPATRTRTASVGNIWTILGAWICTGWQVIVAFLMLGVGDLKFQLPDITGVVLLLASVATTVVNILMTFAWLRPTAVSDVDDPGPRKRRAFVVAYSVILIPAVLLMAGTVTWQASMGSFHATAESMAALLFGMAALIVGWLVVVFGGSSKTVPIVAYDSPSQNLQTALRFIASVLIILGAFFWSWLGIIPGGLWLLVVWSTLAARNRAGELTALWTLSIASRSGRPLGPEVWHHMDRVQGPAQKRLKLLAALLGDGEPLDLALQRSRVLPRNGSMEIQAALDAGQLPDALKAAAARETQRFAQGPDVTESFSISYFAVIVDVMVFIVGFLMYYIIPKFKKIFEDFGTELPHLTISLIRVSDALVNYGLVSITLLLPLSVLAFWADIHARFYGWRSLLERTLGSFWPRLRVADVLRGLAWGIRGERPIAESFAAMTLGKADSHMRQQLRALAEQVRSGVNPWDALLSRGWITSTEAEALHRGEEVGNLPWVLEALADADEKRWEIRLELAVQWLRPILIFIIGLVVAYITIAFFLPLVKLVNDLS
jgi:type II secretory pathway component PulF